MPMLPQYQVIDSRRRLGLVVACCCRHVLGLSDTVKAAKEVEKMDSATE